MFFINDVYPGQYHPRQEGIQKLLHSKQVAVSSYPLSAILLVEGNYRIEVPVPGVKRENIFIEVNMDHIVVRIFNQQRINEDNMPGKKMRIVRKCFIKLPEDADANFATAKINNNLLSIELARKDKQTRNFPGNLVAY